METTYIPIQFAPSTAKGQGERAETALLVRSDHRIAGQNVIRLTKSWKGPKLGKKHDPRQYRWAGFFVQGEKLKLMAAHAPFGADPQKEHNNRLAKWLANRVGFAAILQDANQSIAKTRTNLASPAKARVRGHRIDQAVWRGAELVRMEVLPNYGSDHPAMLYVFEITKKGDKKFRVTLIGWNVQTGRSATAVRSGLTKMIKKYNPDAFALYETYGLHGKLENLPNKK